MVKVSQFELLPLVKGLLLCVVLDAVLSLEKELDFVEKWRGDNGRWFPGERQVESLAVYSNNDQVRLLIWTCFRQLKQMNLPNH